MMGDDATSWSIPVTAIGNRCHFRSRRCAPADADVDFAGRKITVPAEVSKVRRARVLTDLPDNLWAWLEPLKNRPTAHTVAPASYDVWRRAKAQSGVELPKDVLRHSFASYGYHYLGAEHTVEILGHVGGFGVFAKHYKGLANADDAKKYFTILP